jgi:hypothetical protein
MGDAAERLLQILCVVPVKDRTGGFIWQHWFSPVTIVTCAGYLSHPQYDTPFLPHNSARMNRSAWRINVFQC